MVCIADPSHRSGCESVCDGCGYLIADRRMQRIEVVHWSDQDRRTMSNWIPGNYKLAGIGFSSSAAKSLTQGNAGAFPLLLVALLVTFNLLDSILTARALSLGFAEANPVMAGLFSMGLPLGMFFKSAIVGTGSLILWKMRELPLALRGMTAATACYGAVVIYHLYFQLIVG